MTGSATRIFWIGAASLAAPVAHRLAGDLTAGARCRSSATKPTRRCDLSQNGFVCECPQRQSTIASPGGSTNSLPSASITRTGPSTLYGPFARALIVTSAIAPVYGPGLASP